MNISYTKKGDYLLPDLILENKKQYNIGKYGLLRLNYIKKEKLGLYFDLLVNDKLNEYLHNIDTTVMEMVQKSIKELTEKENITEELKNNLIGIENIKGGYGSFAIVRKQEIMCAYNRYRKIKIR